MSAPIKPERGPGTVHVGALPKIGDFAKVPAAIGFATLYAAFY